MQRLKRKKESQSLKLRIQQHTNRIQFQIKTRIKNFIEGRIQQRLAINIEARLRYYMMAIHQTQGCTKISKVYRIVSPPY